MLRIKRVNRVCVLAMAAMVVSGCANLQHLSGAPVVRTEAVADFNSCAKPVYPPEARRHDQVGTVTLMFLIDQNGKVADSKIMKSSGYRSLDQAAIVGISQCKFKPATVDGVPEKSWMPMQYVWTLT